MKPNKPDRPRNSAALDWVVAHRSVDRVYAEVDAQLRQLRRRRIVMAAGALTLIVAGVSVWRGQGVSRVEPTVASSLVAGARHALPDGSIVERKPNADIAIEFRESSRRVVLNKGQAMFFVAKDAARPFVVTANGVEIRAVGTAFSVDLDAQAVEVHVTEGRVAVAQAVSSPATIVDAGNRLIVDLVPPSGQQMLAAPAGTNSVPPPVWRAPRIVLSATPLAKALPMFNQHATLPLVIGDSSLESVELSGVLRADNIDALCQLLKDQFGIVSERVGDRIVLHK